MRLRSAGATLRARLPQRLPWEPWSVVVPLILVQWLVVADIAHRAKHNGWLFHHDGTDTWAFTAAWVFGRGHVLRASVGYGLPLLYAPVTWITGSNLVAALHVILPLQVLVLLPLGVLGAFALGARSGGRVVGYASAFIWTIGPLASISYFAQHTFWVDRILPAIVGLTETGYLPATLALLLAGVFILRALDERQLVDAACAGVAAGIAIAIKPSNVLFLAAPLVAFAAARRARELGAFAAALLPCLGTYVIWRERSAGHIGSLSEALLLPAGVHLSRYHLDVNIGHYLQEVSWSMRVLEWVAVAGFVGLLKRSPVKALFFATWLGAYVLAEGTTRLTQADGVVFWHLLMPAFPAYCVLLASLPLLWPRADRRLADPFPYRPRRVVPATVLAGLALVAALVPLAAVAAVPTLTAPDTVYGLATRELVPVDRALLPVARVEQGRVLLSWKAQHLPATVFYSVYRSAGPNLGRRLTVTRRTAFSEVPPRGTFTYRVAVVASELATPTSGPTVSISPPVTVRTR